MSKYDAYFLSLNPDANAARQWDAGLLLDFLNGDLWQPPTWRGFEIKEVDHLNKGGSALVALPARHHAGREDEINQELAKLKHVVLFLLGDEEADFQVEKLSHDSLHVWVQNPHPGRHDAYNKLGTGYPPVWRRIVMPTLTPDKTKDIFFSGQVTHKRRSDMYKQLREYQGRYDNSDINATDGFTRGLAPEEYYERMAAAKVAPAPSGAVIPDSFRLFEALEAMCFVLADERDPHGKITSYWEWLFGQPVPFALVQDWESLIGYTRTALENYPANIHEQTAWWIRFKRDFAYKVMEQLDA